MTIIRKIKILSFLAALCTVFMVAAPGYSWNGQYRHGSGGSYNRGHHYNYGHHYNGHGYYNGYRNYGHRSWNGYYAGGYHRSYYYPYYYGPSVSLALPFPFFLPGFAFYVGP